MGPQQVDQADDPWQGQDPVALEVGHRQRLDGARAVHQRRQVVLARVQLQIGVGGRVPNDDVGHPIVGHVVGGLDPVDDARALLDGRQAACEGIPN